MGPVQEYISHTKVLIAQYGPDCCVLMQVGSFYELYGLKCEDELEIVGSRIQDVANECDLLIANKGQHVENEHGVSCQVCMAGFGLAQLEKYVRKIQRMGFTCAVYDQAEGAAGVGLERVLKEIISPGTFISESGRCASNMVTCVVLSLGAKHSQMSVSAIDLGTGESEIHCFSHEHCVKQLNYDDVDRCITIANPKESLLVSQELTTQDLLKLVPMLGLGAVKCHVYGSDSTAEQRSKVVRSGRQTAQRDLLCRLFKNMTGDAVTGWMRETGADLQSYVLLLEFIADHNPDFLSRLVYPKLSREVDKLVMANHSLEQLNIIGNSEKRHSSLLALVDHTQTPAGRRLLRKRLTRPYTKHAHITSQLEQVDKWLSEGRWEQLRASLSGLGDFALMFRLIAMGRFKMHHASRLLQYCSQVLSAHRVFNAVDGDESFPAFLTQHDVLRRGICDVVDGDCCARIGDWTPEKLGKLPVADLMFLRRGVCSQCDTHVDEIASHKDRLVGLRDKYAAALVSVEARKVDVGTVLKIVEKDGAYITGTQRRLKLVCSVAGDDKLVCINLPGTRNVYVLDSPTLRAMREALRSPTERLVAALDERWRDVLAELAGMQDVFHAISKFTAYADVIQNSCFVANKHKYTRPAVVDGEKSSIQVRGLRHPLIECINQDELYVANDVALGTDIDMMLLYGTNAVGKSSLIKSIGMCVCMAQAGMYVPCSSLELVPYTKMYTRILGNDDLFRGLSTFAVEMSELRAILHSADTNTLVIGDELCSGTESSSATSIFAAGLMMLHKRRCSAVFATHFHEVALYSELKDLSRLSLKHMTVMYDSRIGDLVYDRKLREGPGNNLYGLEVCKALCLPEELLDTARALRAKYFSSQSISLRSTHYNASKLKGNCELCGATAIEVHHLQHQSSAGTDGYIGSNHKNSVANLMNVCGRVSLAAP